MAENSKIQWTHHTFNPWRGCTKVSEGCKSCYAETLSGRNPKTLGVWGPNGTRVVAAESQWREPLKWDKAAAKAGERHRVFCASLADVFEEWRGPMVASDGRVIIRPYLDSENVPANWQLEFPDVLATDPQGWKPITMQGIRNRLFALIEQTPNLDWLLLTKRPENVLRMTYDAWCRPVPGHVSQNEGDGRHWKWPANVWMGTSVENQSTADSRIPHLLRVPAAVRFLSCEPLLGPVSLTDQPWWDHRSEHAYWKAAIPDARPPIDWVIVGGESGSGSRPMEVEWARSLVAQCWNAKVPVFVKQLGAVPTGSYYADREEYECRGVDWPDAMGWNYRDGQPPLDSRVRLPLLDRKGGDPSEWPADLRIREFPEPTVSS